MRKNKILKILGYSLSIILATTIGYYLAMFKVHGFFLPFSRLSILNILSIFIKFNTFVSYILFQIKEITTNLIFLMESIHFFIPSTGFLSDIIAVQAAVIAIAIPISFDVISRISERYKSSVIINQFNQQWQVKVLPLLLILNIALSVCLKFFITNNPKSLLAIILIYLAFFCFLGILIILGLFFQNVKKYSVDTSYLLNQIYKDIDKNLNIEKLLKIKDDKQLETIQNKLIESFEAIGDILVVEVGEKKANDTILEGFQKIQDSIIIIFKIKDKKPELFERLLVASDFYKLAQKNRVNTSYQLSFNSDNILIVLTTAVNQFIRINETAVNCKNNEISRYSVYNIVYILREITMTPKNDIIVRKLLKDLTNMSRFLIKNKDNSAYIASLEWYTIIVFDLNNQFDLSYLGIFDEYFWSSIKYIIYQDEIKIFEGLVSTVTQGITSSISSPTTNIRSKISPYIYKSQQRDEEVIKSISSLDSQMYNVYSQRNLNSWINQFYNLQHVIDPIIASTIDRSKIKERINSVSNIIQDVSEEFKYKNLQRIIFYTAAYCLFKQKFDYIKYLCNFNQPSDTKIKWINRNIVPSGLEEIIYFYCKINLLQIIYWWADHHGSEMYVTKYFLLLLTREFYKIDSNNYQSTIQKLNFSNHFDSSNLFKIKHQTDEYIKVAEEIKQDNNLLRHLDFDLAKVSESIDNGVIPFLQELKIKAEKQLIILKRKQKISTKKVQEFKDKFIQGFFKSYDLREVFKHYKLLETQSKEESSQSDYGIHTISPDKELFFDSWGNQVYLTDSYYSGYGIENYFIFYKLLSDRYFSGILSAF